MELTKDFEDYLQRIEFIVNSLKDEKIKGDEKIKIKKEVILTNA